MTVLEELVAVLEMVWEWELELEWEWEWEWEWELVLEMEHLPRLPRLPHLPPKMEGLEKESALVKVRLCPLRPHQS